jgi:hypothetical protein
VLVAAPFDGGLEQRFPLNRGQRGEGREGAVEMVAPHKLGFGVVIRAGRLVERVRRAWPYTQRCVVNDALKPGPNVSDHRTPLERHPRVQQPILDRVIREIGRQDPTAPGDQLPPVAAHQHFECTLVPAASQLHQTGVALSREE